MIDRENYAATHNIFDQVFSILNSNNLNIKFTIERIEKIYSGKLPNIKLDNLNDINQIQSKQYKITKTVKEFLNKISTSTLDSTESNHYSENLNNYIFSLKNKMNDYGLNFNVYISSLNSDIQNLENTLDKTESNLFPFKFDNSLDELIALNYKNLNKILDNIEELVSKIILEFTTNYYSLNEFVENEYKIRFEKDTQQILDKVINDFNSRIKNIEEKFSDNFKNKIEINNKKIEEKNLFINERIKEYNTIIDTIETNYKERINFLNKQTDPIYDKIILLDKDISKIQEKNSELDVQILNFNSKINDIVSQKSKELNDNLENEIKFIEINISTKINEISSYYDEAKKNYESFTALAEKAGSYELTHYYLKKAKEEKLEFKNYRRYTTISIVLAILSTIFVVLLPFINQITSGHTNTDSEQYYSVFSRLAISIVFFILALYLSKQSSKHYECYQENYDIYLQLATIEPFISRLDEDDKILIRKELVHVYFGQKNEGKYASKGDEVTTLTTLITPIVEKLVTRKDSNTTS
ncbi:hypothetical protein J5N52_04615 [Acinetobacter soli]|uniref:hypothetical protein n=1 Tax=Acinetobacter soli TaxID=487316 RepID=UPI001ABCE08C|nr:hypothetical protein [Acinetobacter soli]MBO3671306.1 hypothetical protein [Acinetobacter soli]